jgi:hypothetical protein
LPHEGCAGADLLVPMPTLPTTAVAKVDEMAIAKKVVG